jgi:hypothetical protein
LIGVIEPHQREETGENNRNDRLIGVATQSLLYFGITRINDLNATVLQQIEAFFVNYQKLRNVEFTIHGRRELEPVTPKLCTKHFSVPRKSFRSIRMATAVWKGALSFGLLSIPIRLYTAARSERTSLHQLHNKCHRRLRQP